MARTHRDQPHQLTSTWPDVPSEDPVAETARRLALNLQEAIGESSLRSVAEFSGVSHVTISAILAGRIFPDTATLARLELGLDADLWPSKAELRDINLVDPHTRQVDPNRQNLTHS